MLTGGATKKCAIWCVLDKLCGSYSLTEVIEEQIRMLALHRYPVEVWMLEDWRLEDDPRAQALLQEFPGQGVRFLPIVPRLLLYDYHEFGKPLGDYAAEDDPHPSFHEKSMRIAQALATRMGEVDCVLTHDILFQTWYLPHGDACRKLGAAHPSVRWFHWQHSGPCARPMNELPPLPHRSRFMGMPRSVFVYPNDNVLEVERVAEMRGLSAHEIAFVPNSRDLLDYLDAPLTVKNFVRSSALLEADLIITIPARLDGGKQPKKAIQFLWALRQCGIDARLIWCAAYANLGKQQHEECWRELWDLAHDLGIRDNALYFTNEQRVWADCVPRDAVRAFQQISDMLVLPSLSEAHSLVAMEAAICRQTLVLNEDFAPMGNWFPEGTTFPVQFGSRLQTRAHHPPGQPEAASVDAELLYFYERAQKLLGWLDLGGLPAFRFQRKHRNLQSVFKKHLERVLWSI